MLGTRVLFLSLLLFKTYTAANSEEVCYGPGVGSNDDCCTPSNPCPLGGADCDKDADCQGLLRCGNDNCRDFFLDSEHDDDCCYNPFQKYINDCHGPGGRSNDDCCTPSNPCPEGGADCDKDSDCLGHLKCGNDNCRDFFPDSEHDDDCCYDPTKKSMNSTNVCHGPGGSSNDNCCTPSNPCPLGGADCDEDADCLGHLKCGNDNCRDFFPDSEHDDDCCYDPFKSSIDVCHGPGGSSNDNCCTPFNPCPEGGADCDEDADCQGHLKCGTDNCRDFFPDSEHDDDCCYDPTKNSMNVCHGPGGRANDDCCTPFNPCPEGGADCDTDADCQGDLICGKDNCRDFFPSSEHDDDCCYNPRRVNGTNICHGPGGRENDDCCTPSNPCPEGGADCDRDADCLGHLKCGIDNCKDFFPNSQHDDDCCYDPSKYGIAIELRKELKEYEVRLDHCQLLLPHERKVRENSLMMKLHQAVKDGDLKAIEILLSLGADVNAKDDHGRTSLYIAAFTQGVSLATVKLLLALGADKTITDAEGKTPLHAAAMQANVEVIRLFIDIGADVNAEDEFGRTPLYDAASSIKDSIDTVKLLLENGADKKITDKDGKTPLQIAEEENNLYMSFVLKAI